MLLVDTNVLVDVLEDDHQWADWSIGQLRAQSKIHSLAINPVIYSELSLRFSTVEAQDETITKPWTGHDRDAPPRDVSGGKGVCSLPSTKWHKNNVLGDFFIGAYAEVSGHPLLTRDVRRYTAYFSGVTLISPGVSTRETEILSVKNKS